MGAFRRGRWFVAAYMWILFGFSTDRTPNEAAAEASVEPAQAVITVGWTFTNGTQIGDFLSGWICVPTDIDQNATGPGFEELRVQTFLDGVPRGSITVRVEIRRDRSRFFFKGEPATLAKEIVTDTNGIALFDFEAMDNLGEAQIRISVASAGFQVDTTGTSFKLINEKLFEDSTATTVLIGTEKTRKTNSAKPPNVKGKNAFTGPGGIVQGSASTMFVDDNDVYSARVEGILEFHVTPVPALVDIEDALEGTETVLEDYTARGEITAGKFSAVVAEAPDVFAEAGFRVQLDTTGISGVAPQQFFPGPTSGEFKFVRAPFVNNRGVVKRRAQASPLGVDFGPENIDGPRMGIRQPGMVTFTAFARASASGATADASAKMNLKRIFVSLIPGCPF